MERKMETTIMGLGFRVSGFRGLGLVRYPLRFRVLGLGFKV